MKRVCQGMFKEATLVYHDQSYAAKYITEGYLSTEDHQPKRTNPTLPSLEAIQVSAQWEVSLNPQTSDIS